jgi:cyclase
MLKTRVIPCLLLHDGSLVKTVRFSRFGYIGDPANTVRIFNELEVDELIVLDIRATRHASGIDFELLAELADECFMPLAYGGGVASVEDFKRIVGIGVEKVALNTAALEDPALIARCADACGSQSVIVSIDVRRDFLGRQRVFGLGGRRNAGRDPVEWAQAVERQGAGEILLTSIEREGTWSGFDLDLVRRVSAAVGVPLIAHGGAGSLDDIEAVVREGGASAVAVGSMVVYQKKGMGVLVNFPERKDLEARLARAAS